MDRSYMQTKTYAAAVEYRKQRDQAWADVKLLRAALKDADCDCEHEIDDPMNYGEVITPCIRCQALAATDRPEYKREALTSGH